MPPVHKRDRWRKIAALRVTAPGIMAYRLEDNRGQGEHEAIISTAPPASSHDPRWTHNGRLPNIAIFAFPFKFGS